MKVDMNPKCGPKSWRPLNPKRQTLQTSFTKRKSEFHDRRTGFVGAGRGRGQGERVTQSMRVQVASNVNPMHRCLVDLTTMRTTPVPTCRSMVSNATETETSVHVGCATIAYPMPLAARPISSSLLVDVHTLVSACLLMYTWSGKESTYQSGAEYNKLEMHGIYLRRPCFLQACNEHLGLQLRRVAMHARVSAASQDMRDWCPCRMCPACLAASNHFSSPLLHIAPTGC